jgi:alkylated DNA nucleotide flippase Atl1
MKTFSDKVRDIVRKIPKGKTMTYKAVAAKAGNPKAARAVGAIMRTKTHRSRVIALLQATAQCAATFVRAVGRPNNDPLDRELHAVSRNNVT